MEIDDSILDYNEVLSLRLRSLFASAGFECFKLNKFEEYDFYSANRDFLVSDRVISFTDTDGKLLALKPDITLSVVRSCAVEPNQKKRVYYDEKVYRVSSHSGHFKELSQVGVECLGALNCACVSDVLLLAAQSLEVISPNNMLVISSLDIINELLDSADYACLNKKQVFAFMSKKNIHGLKDYCADCGLASQHLEKLIRLVQAQGSSQQIIGFLREEGYSQQSIDELETVQTRLTHEGFANKFRLDFSLVEDCNYYNGVIFHGFVPGAFECVLSGGSYDKLMNKLNLDAQAIGFAVYADSIPTELLSKQSTQCRTSASMLRADVNSEDLVYEGGNAHA